MASALAEQVTRLHLKLDHLSDRENAAQALLAAWMDAYMLEHQGTVLLQEPEFQRLVGLTRQWMEGLVG
jgi:hypothetical protein